MSSRLAGVTALSVLSLHDAIPESLTFYVDFYMPHINNDLGVEDSYSRCGHRGWDYSLGSSIPCTLGTLRMFGSAGYMYTSVVFVSNACMKFARDTSID